MVKLSYIHSKDAVYNIERSLSLIKTEITKGVKNKSRVVILVDVPRQSSKRVIEAPILESLLNFITPHLKSQVTVAGQSEKGNTLDLFKDLGYLKFQDQYDFAACDLNEEEQITLRADDEELLVPGILAESDFIILLAAPKISDNKLIGALGNILPHRIAQKHNIFEKIFGARSQGSSLSDSGLIVKLFEKYKIGLSVIDGHRTIVAKNGIEDILPTNFAICSTNPLEADVLTSMCLGLEPETTDYIAELNPDLSTVFVVGDDWNKFSLLR